MVFVCHFLPLSGNVIFPEISAGIKQIGLSFNEKLGERTEKRQKHCSGGIPDSAHAVFI